MNTKQIVQKIWPNVQKIGQNVWHIWQKTAQSYNLSNLLMNLSNFADVVFYQFNFFFKSVCKSMTDKYMFGKNFKQIGQTFLRWTKWDSNSCVICAVSTLDKISYILCNLSDKFSKNRPLGGFFLLVAMSVCLSVCLSVPFPCNIFKGLSLALRSHDQFKASHWSTLLPSLPPPTPGPPLEDWTRGPSMHGALKTRSCSGLD